MKYYSTRDEINVIDKSNNDQFSDESTGNNKQLSFSSIELKLVQDQRNKSMLNP